MKHKHCDVIKAWADGAVIQFRSPSDSKWEVWKMTLNSPNWLGDVEYRASLAIVEGKPVFEGSELYSTSVGGAFGLKCKVLKSIDKDTLQVMFDNWFDRCGEPLSKLSWNPPKPKTITVTILRPDCLNWDRDTVTITIPGFGSETYDAIKEGMK